MDQFSIRDIIVAIGAKASGKRSSSIAELGGTIVKRVSIDSRDIVPGDVFFAIKGANHDAHEYVADALSKGAVCAVVESEMDSGARKNGTILRVDDTIAALLNLAAFQRSRIKGKVVAITGSNGKTTTKVMLGTLLHSELPENKTIVSEKSFNNNIGVPLTILRADRETKALVLEIGTNAPGEIAQLAGIAQPDIAAITGIGDSHLEGLHSREGVAREKGNIFRHLTPFGIGFHPSGDMYINLAIAQAAERSDVQYRSVGFGKNDSVFAERTEISPFGTGMNFRINRRVTARLPILGIHNITNALIAAGIAMELGVPLEELRERFPYVTLPPNRLELKNIGKFTVINDAYNANPTSVAAAASELARVSGSRKRSFFVLGDMLELGAQSKNLHESTGESLSAFGFDEFMTVGEMSAHASKVLGSRGKKVNHFAEAADAAIYLGRTLGPGDIVMLKGSRRVRLEIIEDYLRHMVKSTNREYRIAR
ncbi:MAG: UDP-N-acetylmuramoyl-tripeptide--D-alanyl-D-alanine ligase [Planctomycetes bacterium]|nr:UDP-N-acetylmuramoyl-tripeptide--D-alanyl-D-alanine ligase [Planctomycetota bacterium]